MQFLQALLFLWALCQVGFSSACKPAVNAGYTPASEAVLSESRKITHTCTSAAASFSITDTFIELENIRMWPKELIYDQGTLKSCTANSMDFILRFLSVMNSSDKSNFLTNPARLDPSRNFHYWNTRFYEGVFDEDALATTRDRGASLAGAILALDKYGCCPEAFSGSLETLAHPDLSGEFTYIGFPYNPKAFKQQPTPEDYRFALDEDPYGISEKTMFSSTRSFHENPYACVAKRLRYEDLSGTFRKDDPKVKNTDTEVAAVISNICAALSENKPIYFGMLVNSKFRQSKDGFIKTPSMAKFFSKSGHAIAIVGYGPYNVAEPRKNYFKFINSWGPSWGDGGFGYLEEDYVGNVNIFQTEAFSVSLPFIPSVPIPTAAKSLTAKKVSKKRGPPPPPLRSAVELPMTAELPLSENVHKRKKGES